MTEPKILTPNRIIHHIIDSENDPLGSSKDYAYIIMGDNGPTGKTWLCNGLKLHGFNAVEPSEDMNHLISYNDHKNHFIVNELDKIVVIVLNHKLHE